MPITTKVVSSNPTHGEVSSIHNYVIKFVDDLRQVTGFIHILSFPPPIKLTAMIYKNVAEMKVALNTIILSHVLLLYIQKMYMYCVTGLQ